MSFDYISNPQTIEQESFRQIRSLVALEHLNQEQQQVVMRIVHSCGLPEIAKRIRFSQHACSAGIKALKNHARILCDVEMVKQGITKRLIDTEPLCFLNDPRLSQMTTAPTQTRSMAALELMKVHFTGSVVLIANAPTALFRLLELLEQGADKPALVIGIPVGFVGATESKQALWDRHEALGIECMTLLGREGGSAITASACNALLRCLHGEYY